MATVAGINLGSLSIPVGCGSLRRCDMVVVTLTGVTNRKQYRFEIEKPHLLERMGHFLVTTL
jgi:hypothetical protein